MSMFMKRSLAALTASKSCISLDAAIPTESEPCVTAFLLTWKETGWPHEEIVRMAARCETQGYVEEPWRIIAYKRARAGDKVWVLRGEGTEGNLWRRANHRSRPHTWSRQRW